jgi:hypothetical protein
MAEESEIQSYENEEEENKYLTNVIICAMLMAVFNRMSKYSQCRRDTEMTSFCGSSKYNEANHILNGWKADNVNVCPVM